MTVHWLKALWQRCGSYRMAWIFGFFLAPSVLADSAIYDIPGIDSSVIDKFMQPGFDASIQILNDVVGTLTNVSSLSSKTSPYAVVTKNLVDYFTRGMFSIALILFSYTTIIGTIYTASEGEVMGRKLQTFFVLFRTLLSMALYFPMQSGYSVLQTVITNIVLTSIMVANYAWYTVVSLMVTSINGPLGLMLLSGVGEQFSFEQTVTSTADQIAGFIDSTSAKYLEAEKTSELASEAIYMGQFAQMICVYDNYYNKDTENGIANAQSALTNAIFCSGADCPFVDPQSPITLELPSPGGDGVKDCGKVYFNVNADYLSVSGAVIQPVLSQLNSLAKVYYQDYKSNGSIDSATANTLASELYTMTSDNLSQQITTYNQTTITQNSGNQTQEDWVNKLIAGGWAMAANNFFYYSYTLFNASADLASATDYSKYIYVTPQKNEQNFEFCSSGGTLLENTCNYLLDQTNGLGRNVECLITPNNCQSTSEPETYDAGSMQACANDINQCQNIKQYLMANKTENGQTIVTAKDFVKVFYNGWKTQISNMDDIKSFAEIESMTKLCNLPFATSSLNLCQDTETFLTPDTSGPFFISGVVAAAIGLAALPIRIAWIPVVAVFDAYYAGIAFYQSFSDIYTIWTDPNKLYPDTLALSVQSFTYFTVKAWFDTFANNQAMVFVFPVQAISAFGFRVLLYCVSFIFNVGTATFAANLSMTIDMFLRQIIIDSSIALAQWYGDTIQAYGWWWIYAQFPGEQFLVDIAAIKATYDLAEPFIPPFMWWILFIPAGLILGGVLVAIGTIANIIVMIGTIIEIFDPAKMVLQINSFIISKWNPLYFAIATPLISIATLFSFFLPMYPIVVYTLTIITWVTQYIETLLAMPIILLGMANPEGHSPLLGKAEKAIMLLAILFMRPITIVMGFVLANVIASISAFFFFQTIIPLLDMQIGQWAKGYATLVLGGSVGATKVLDTGDVTIQAVMTMIALVMFTMVFYYMILNAYSLIYKLPNSIASWIGVNMANNTQEEEILQQISGEVNNITGSLTSASTEIAGKQGQATAAGGDLDMMAGYQKGKQDVKKDQAQGDAAGGTVFNKSNYKKKREFEEE